ncbi:MAG: FHA domain-containing protein [Gammaproteobacteria bacterium]|nr:FHA domain-containing protein [Gammaproteobacteria bacterium]
MLRTIVLPVLFWCAQAVAWTGLNENLEVQCTQADDESLNCRYRLIQGNAASGIRAEAAGTALAVTGVENYPWTGARTALLVLVDTSDPGRQAVIEKNIAQIDALLKSARPHQSMGLASFNNQLRIESPLGTSPEKISATAKSLKAVGLTTELYRSVIQAVDTLGRFRADRRAILLFSDGQAEDRAYFHADVIAAARKAGVAIHGLGFARSVALSVALQNLRRLSEETGGLYIEADANFNLPADFAGRLTRSVDSGGRFSVDLAPVISDSSLPAQVRLGFQAAAVQMEIDVPINLPRPAVAMAAQAPEPARGAAQPAAGVPEVRLITTPPARSRLDQWLWYGVPLALITLIILTLLTLFIISHRTSPRRAAAAPMPEQKALAYLISQDEKPRRFPITRTIWRIGRGRDNELVLDDSSVSRRHAEIKRAENGTFTLYDRHSLNGVYLNTAKVEQSRLSEGDIIEIGDIVLRFTESPPDEHLQEQTSVQHTRAPRVT